MKLEEAIEAAEAGPRNALTAFIGWCERNDIVPLHVELGLWNRDKKYAGTVDNVMLVRGNLTIIDLKTSKKLYGHEHLQTAAHAASVMSMKPEEIAKSRQLLQLNERRDGHWYELRGVGTWPSVTTVLDKTISKGGIEYWASDEAIEAVLEVAEGQLSTSQSLRAAMAMKYGVRRSGSINPPCLLKKEQSAAEGTSAHKLCELWLLQRAVDPISAQSILSKHLANGTPSTMIIRLPKDGSFVETRSRKPDQVEGDIKAFYAARELFAWHSAQESGQWNS